MSESTVHHATARFDYDGNGILVVTIHDDIELTLQDIQDHREIAARMVENKPHCVLAIAGERTQATAEARHYAAANIPLNRIAEAVVIKSLTVRILGNFYMQFHKPGVPTKMFDDRYEAVQWLKMQLNQAEKKNPN